MKHFCILVLGLGLVAALVPACAQNPTNELHTGTPPHSNLETFNTAPTSSETGKPTQGPASPSLEAEQTMRDILVKAKTDLMGRLETSMDQIHVKEARAVTWPDTSLGCPQTGAVYAAVLTNGYIIILETHGKQFPYHTDLNKRVILCEVSSEVNDSPPNGDKSLKDGWPNQSKEDDVFVLTPTKKP